MSGTGTYNPRALDGFPKKNRFYLKDGSNIFRVLPPFGSLKNDGIVAKYWAVYWLPTTKKNRKGEDISFPVPSMLEMTKDKKIITPDPIYDKVQNLTKSLEAMKAGKQHPEAVITALEERLKKLQLDKAYYLNVISPAGEIGSLKLRYTAFQALKEKLRDLEKLSIDPINIGVGVYFDFKKGKDDKGKTVYTVDIHQKTSRDPQTGGFKTEIVEARIDNSILDRMEKEAFDLATLYKRLTVEEQAMAASLDPVVIERLFARPEDSEQEQVYVDEEEQELKANAPAATTAAPVQTAAAVQQTATTPAPAPAATTQAPAATPAPQAQAPAAPVGGPAPNAAVNAGSADFNDYVKKFLQTGGQPQG